MPKWLATRQDQQFFYALREEPLEMGFAAAAVISSLYTLVSATYPVSIQALLTFPFQIIWNGYLLLGGLLVLIGLSRSTISMQTRGTATEKAGLTLVAVGCLIYGLAIIGNLGFSSPFLIVLMLLAPGFFWLRIRQINHLIKSNKEMVEGAKQPTNPS